MRTSPAPVASIAGRSERRPWRTATAGSAGAGTAAVIAVAGGDSAGRAGAAAFWAATRWTGTMNR